MATHRILLIGVGELGTAMLSCLTGHPSISTSSITVLLRLSTNRERDATITTLRSKGAEIINGDIVLDSEDDLVNIFLNFDTIIGCTGLGCPPGTQLRLARAVLKAATGRDMRYFPWQWGIDYDAVGQGSAQDLFDEQLEVRKLLRAQRETDWVIVSTGLFISFLFVPEFGPVDLKARKLRGLGSWETCISLTSPKDIGRVAAEIIFDPRGINRQVVYVAGSTVSYGDVAKLVEDRFRGEWERELWDLDALRKKLEDNPNDGMAKYQNVFGAGTGVAWDMRSTVNEQRGLSMQTVEDYLDRDGDLKYKLWMRIRRISCHYLPHLVHLSRIV
ncbi:hypothetical protein GGR57DRAFT_11817 [Xylariaceae sp. FL1272]|nr:hypothetical protein GGR57DRAFT_11817 [Xylariaceae sp. FL1272]